MIEKTEKIRENAIRAVETGREIPDPAAGPGAGPGDGTKSWPFTAPTIAKTAATNMVNAFILIAPAILDDQLENKKDGGVFLW